jgi:hypothetical protein
MNWFQVKDIGEARALLEGGTMPNAGDLANIASRGNTAVMKFLIDAGADIRHADILADSVISCTPAMVTLLLDAGADPTSGDNRAVKWAAGFDNRKIIQVLADHMRHSSICRYYYYSGALYIHYSTPPPGTDLLPGTSIWCSDPWDATPEYIETILQASTVKKSAYFFE